VPFESPILVTGASGRVGGVGRMVVERLRGRGLPVRALVHREDKRAETLRAAGTEVVVADLAVPPDVARAVEGCRRVYFGMSVSAPYLEATVIAAAVARERVDMVNQAANMLGGTRPELLRLRGSDLQILEYVKILEGGFAPLTNWSGLNSQRPQTT
jgi:nucleoside-diphosphate-sugar epimerase